MTPSHLPPHGIIFDLDGTLVDTITDIASAMNRVLAKHGFRQHSVESYTHRIGWGLKDLTKRTLIDSLGENGRHEVTPELIAACSQELNIEYGARLLVETRPYPHITEMLMRVRQHNIPLAVLSNKRHEFTATIVSQLFGEEIFALSRGLRDGDLRKPDPSVMKEILATLKVAPENAIYVGDSATDAEVAINAGMRFIGVTWGFQDHEKIAAVWKQRGYTTSLRFASSAEQLGTLLLQ